MSILKPTHTPEEISKKFNVSIDKINAQLVKGIRVESEHTTDKSIARQIALHHLWEKPNYYDQLKKVEEGKSLWRFFNEAFHTTIKRDYLDNRNIDVYKNPSRSEMKDIFRDSEHKRLRAILQNQDAYVWDAGKATHHRVHMGLGFRNDLDATKCLEIHSNGRIFCDYDEAQHPDIIKRNSSHQWIANLVQSGKFHYDHLNEAAMNVGLTNFSSAHSSAIMGDHYEFTVGNDTFRVWLKKQRGTYGTNIDVAFGIRTLNFSGKGYVYAIGTDQRNSKASQVLSYVVSVVYQYLSKNKDIDYLSFSATDQSKQKVYAALGKGLMKKLGMKTYGFVEVGLKDGNDKSYYIFFTPESKSKFEDDAKETMQDHPWKYITT